MKIRIEFIIFIITAALVFNTYHDGKYFKMVDTPNVKKYVKMATFAFVGLSLFLFIRKNPQNSHMLMMHATDLVKYMPIEKGTVDLITPFFDMTHKRSIMETETDTSATMMNAPLNKQMNMGAVMNTTATKRSVSESKKKFVAAQQSWRCGDCKIQLPGWYEVDHKVRLDRGGSNDVDNLVALCRDCHGKKTAYENF